MQTRTILQIAAAALASTCAFAAPKDVKIESGQLAGVARDGVISYKGIPFAQPPVGDLRWRAPLTAKAWTGVREANVFSAPCAQNSGGQMMENSSEDCLYLNVWTPAWPANARMPVMFWIHGGGNYGGTASGNNFDGESLSRHGVVVVTANYRLSIFGWFSHPELTRESQNHASGNYGLMDQIAALKWVRDNIARFGGDPANVTVFGQSAGAVDANVLMTSPLSSGLFTKVIAESGTVTRNPDAATMNMTALGALMKVKGGPVTYNDAPGLLEAEQRGEALAASLKAPVPGSLKFLRGLPASELLKAVAAPQMAIGPANGVVIDGYVIPKAPAEVFLSGKELRVPLLIGNNSRERTPPDVKSEDVAKAASAMYGPLADRAAKLYGLGEPDTPDPLYGGQAAQWVVDTMYRCPVVAELNWHVAAGNTGYEYQFDRAAPGREALGSTHGAEVPYVFGTLGPQYKDADRAASAAIGEYWTNFARTGAPGVVGQVQWPKFDVAARGYMEFTDAGPAAREALRRPFCELYVENAKRLGAR